jgi:hypothetical protein|tara:strand:+ start:184 stop:459 length:276 start_codon:yes stop_codon:yes gene_type:complete
MSEDTVYINKISIKEKTFDNGGSVLNVAVHVDELIIHKNKDGWVNLSICQRREISDKGHTHYAKLNTYTPPTEVSTSTETESTESDTDLPF